MAEALLRHVGSAKFESLSAGSFPAGYVHAVAIDAMNRLGVPMVGQCSKSWDEFVNAPVDVVITLCDDAARQACPILPGSPLKAHWPMPDPSFHPGTETERQQFAVAVANRLRAKIEELVKVDFTGSDPATLQSALTRISQV